MNEIKNNNQLPKDWKWVKLGDVCKLKNGFAFKSSEYIIDGVPVIRISDIKSGSVKPDKSVRVAAKRDYEGYIVLENEILVAMSGATTGKFGIFKSKEKAYQNQRVGKFQILNKENLDNDFLLYQLHALKRKIEKDAYGGAQPNISSGKIEAMEMLLPPKPTQLAIVSKIEELFSELDKGIEQLKTAQQQLKTYRQSVLKWAFEGKLTNDQSHDSSDLHKGYDLNIAAEEEIEYKTKKKPGNQNNHIHHGSNKGELPEGWKWVASGEFFDFVTSGSRGWAKYYSEKGAIFIRITNLDFDSLELDLEDRKIQYVNPPLSSEGIRTKVQEGDFLFSITGYLGMLAIAPKLENAYVNQHVCLCRPKNNFNKRYLGYWIISKSGGHHYLNKNPKGAVKAGLNLEDLKTFPVPLCPVHEQDEIVKVIEIRLSIADKMEESIRQSLQQAETLRQSILKKAFEGKL